MKRWVSSTALAALLIATAASGQDAPKSLLPDVFGAPPPEAPPPAPRPVEREPDAPAAAETPTAGPSAGVPVPLLPGVPAAQTPAAPDPFASGPARAGSFDVAGPLTARLGGYGMGA
ncbi:MAG: hypothetical protein H3C60_08615, partial [Sphingomonadaceae bacterium]|nr:hypothetical protein [Sphingomonadaceae bacterium]